MTSASPRGYLLMEVVIGGALAAAVLLGVLSQVAAVRVRATIAARETTAVQLASEKIEEKIAEGFATASGTTTEAAVAAVAGTFTRTTVVGAAATETIGTLTVPLKTVVVTVTFNPSVGGVRSMTSSTKLYGP